MWLLVQSAGMIRQYHWCRQKNSHQILGLFRYACYIFSADDIISSTSIPEHFMHIRTFISYFENRYFISAMVKVVAPKKHMKSANIQNLVGFMTLTGIRLA